jgi:DNA-3-methyladenine glycosylase II
MTQPAWWAEAQRHLRADPVLAALMRRHPDSILKTRGAALETLQRAIVGQQISVKAADSVWRKTLAAVGEINSPAAWLKLSEAQLRGCGLSGQKVRYVRGIASGFVDGTVHPPRWPAMADDAIIAELVKLPGIGRWTAEMYLIFHLLRPDVLPVDDLGLLKGYVQAYGPVRGTKTLTGMKRWKKIGAALGRQAESWRPYRTLATWYLWRSLDPVEVLY